MGYMESVDFIALVAVIKKSMSVQSVCYVAHSIVSCVLDVYDVR